MKEFLIKTIKLWLALICFGIAIGLFYLLSDFFSNGGGFVRVKGLIAPFIFVIFGVSLLCSFIKTSFNNGNRYYGIIAILFVALIGGGVWYFNSTSYQNKRQFNNVMNGTLSEDEALAGIGNMLKEHTPESTDLAIQCLEHLDAKGSKKATFLLGEIYFDEIYEVQDYSKALKYLDKSREAYEIAETNDDFVVIMPHELTKSYEYLGDIYSQGLAGKFDKDKALHYYRLSLKGQLKVNAGKIEHKIEALSPDSVSSINE